MPVDLLNSGARPPPRQETVDFLLKLVDQQKAEIAQLAAENKILLVQLHAMKQGK